MRSESPPPGASVSRSPVLPTEVGPVNVAPPSVDFQKGLADRDARLATPVGPVTRTAPFWSMAMLGSLAPPPGTNRSLQHSILLPSVRDYGRLPLLERAVDIRRGQHQLIGAPALLDRAAERLQPHLVTQALEISPRLAVGGAGQLLQVNLGSPGDLGEELLQQAPPPVDVRQPDLDRRETAVLDRLVDDVEAVGGADEEHAGGGAEPVELAQELGHDALLPRRGRAGRPAPEEGVDLVDEDDGRPRVSRAAEQLGDALLGFAHPLGEEVGRRHLVERRPDLGGEGLRDGRLARPG